MKRIDIIKRVFELYLSTENCWCCDYCEHNLGFACDKSEEVEYNKNYCEHFILTDIAKDIVNKKLEFFKLIKRL